LIKRNQGVVGFVSGRKELMLSPRSFLAVKAVGALIMVWVAVWGVLKVAGVFEVTPEKVAAFVEAQPISEIVDEAERRAWLDEMAGMVNQLDFEHRRAFRERNESAWEDKGEGSRGFWGDLSREERMYFVDLTMGTAFKQMMKGFNEMGTEERRAFVERARADMEKQGRDPEMARLEREDDEMYEKIVREGMESYYRDANADTKRDLAPLMEEMQRLMKNPGHRERRQMMRTRPSSE
jgi:biopolymer transport protein ExbB/TolQ